VVKAVNLYNAHGGMDMVELHESQFKRVLHFLKNTVCDTVAAYEIIENRQRGRVFVDNPEIPSSVLFWHYGGFAMLSGDSTNDNFNNNIYRLLSRDFENNQRRFALVVYNSGAIDDNIIKKIQGTIIPSFILSLSNKAILPSKIIRRITTL